MHLLGECEGWITRRHPWRCQLNGLYGFAIAILKVLGVLALAGYMARGFVAFGRWRTSLRNRLSE